MLDGPLTVEMHVKITELNGVELTEIKQNMNKIKEKLRNFDESVKEFSDIVLKVKDEKFYVLKTYLAVHSTYFQSLFAENFDESEKSEIELKDIDPYDFQNFLEVLYAESAINDDTVRGILQLAGMYDSKTAIRRCEEFLVQNSEKFLKMKFETAIKYKMDKLKGIKPTMSADEKKEFVIKGNLSEGWGSKQHSAYCSTTEKHFNVPWRTVILTHRGPRKVHEIRLECMKSRGESEWSIEIETELVLNSKTGKGSSTNRTSSSESKVSNHIFSSHGNSQKLLKVIEAKEVEKYLVNGSLSLEIYVKINEMTGMKEKLRDFDESTEEFSDVVLIVNNEKFYVCKMFLASHSTYFKSLFSGNFSESQKSEIELEDVDSYDFQNFLELIHGESSIDDDTVEGILLLADMYDSKTAIRRCEEFLIEKSKKSLRTKFEAAVKCKMDKLKKKCLSQMVTEFDIRSVLPEDVYQFDQSVWADLLLKALSLKSSS